MWGNWELSIDKVARRTSLTPCDMYTRRCFVEVFGLFHCAPNCSISFAFFQPISMCINTVAYSTGRLDRGEPTSQDDILATTCHWIQLHSFAYASPCDFSRKMSILSFFPAVWRVLFFFQLHFAHSSFLPVNSLFFEMLDDALRQVPGVRTQLPSFSNAWSSVLGRLFDSAHWNIALAILYPMHLILKLCWYCCLVV